MCDRTESVVNKLFGIKKNTALVLIMGYVQKYIMDKCTLIFTIISHVDFEEHANRNTTYARGTPCAQRRAGCTALSDTSNWKYQHTIMMMPSARMWFCIVWYYCFNRHLHAGGIWDRATIVEANNSRPCSKN